ncbi:MAG TPA: 50S ribosomal protein L11 methyltransferase [Stellaceae bacterium]|nr:50S ribosomal protein L11 methyltransferase [Stellaceae bacterium]
MSSERDFVRDHTAIASPPLVPEIRLHLATEVTPLWQATEATLQQSQLPPPYWAFAWAGGQALARHLLDHPALVAGRDVLDFGTGGGVVAIAAAKAGARVTAAEPDRFALAALALNAALNDVGIAVANGDVLASHGAWDAVLAGDMCYERPLAERLVAWLTARAHGGALILLGDPGRAYLPATGLQALARYWVPTPLDLEDREARETTVWQLTG